MKLSRTSWLILAGGIFIVIIVGLVLTRSQQLKEQSRLDEELNIAEMRLDKLQVQQLHDQEEELQAQLEENKAQLTAAKDDLNQSIASVDVTEKFFAIAQACGVEVASIDSSSIKDEKLGEINCSVITLNAVVTGDVPNLISFVIKLNNDFTSGKVNSVRMSIPEDSGDDEPSVSLVMAVYAYKGA